jgi:Secretion system C-terminal sorting domain/Cleaved Adhesin Domain/Fibronectin type III domain
MKKLLLSLLFFVTALNVTAQFSENFDASTTLPVGWAIINGGGANGFVIGANGPAGTAHSPTNTIAINYDATAHDDYVVTPLINVLAGVSDRLTYWVKNQDPAYVEAYEVKLSPIGSSAADFTVTLTPSALAPNAWTQFTIDLTTYVGQSVYIGFHATSTDKFRLHFDDIVNDSTPSCNAPTLVVASTVTVNSATISWTAPTTAPALGYEYYYSTTNTAPTAVTVATGSTAAGVTTTNLTGLTVASSYYVWVRSLCSAADKSAWSNSTTFNTTLAPGCATIIAPADLDTDVTVTLSNNATTPATRQSSVTLSWTAPTTGSVATGYDIYWGASEASLVKLNTTPFVGTIVNILGITYNTTFFWKIVPVNAGGGSTTCSVQSFTTGALPTGCMAGTLWPTATFTPTTCNGTTVNEVVADGFAGEYSNIAVNAGQSYKFQSSVATDFISLSTDAGITAIAGGITPIIWTATTAGTVRFYTHLNSNCATENVNRVRSIICGAALATTSFDVSSLNVFPSPVKNTLNISFDKNINSVSIYNILGQEVITKNVNATESKIDMSKLSSGNYLVKIISDNVVKTVKVVKE